MRILFMIVACFLIVAPANAQAEESMQTMGHWPMLHQGRVKPVDTYAKSFLTSLYGRDHYQTRSASDWLSQLLFAPDQAYTEEVFYIPNPDVLYALGISPRQGHRYSFLELTSGFAEYIDEINRLEQMDKASLTPAQQQLVEVYIKSLQYLELSRSFSMVLPKFHVTQPEVAAFLNVEVGAQLTYLNIYSKKMALTEHVNQTAQKAEEDLTKADREFFLFYQYLLRLERDQNSKSFRIFPPQWAFSNGLWLSPWQVLMQGAGSPDTAALFKQLAETASLYKQPDEAGWTSHINKIGQNLLVMAGDDIDVTRHKLEYIYNTLDPLYISLMLYIASFIVLMASGLFWKSTLYKLSLTSFFFGGLCHLSGILLRMYIMSRPPVATLYESILFVGLIVVIFAWILERRQSNKLGLLLGAAMGCILHFLARKYAAEGDTMGMLVAVLNTNFWLATHVVTITIGYGCCLVAGVLAHIYLVKKWLHPDQREVLALLTRNILAVSLIALFFSSLGTILGGIWADQSWGRFWGWDPKENGAMLICLWLIWLLHGRVAGTIKNGSFVIGVAFTNIIVALAWFGVNLLNVGLHSYGFTEGIFRNLVLFTSGEILFIVTFWGLITRKQFLNKGS